MNPIELLKQYFADRYCTKLVIDSESKQVELHVNTISRIRDKSCEWNSYFDEDIDNGVVVITGVKKVTFDESVLTIENQTIGNINC